MLLTIFFIIQGALACHQSLAACTGASPIWMTTPDYNSVNSCVGKSRPGDTVKVLAGAAFWDSSLSITKGINLIGAGSGVTKIVSNLNSGYLIGYKPSDYSANWLLRISGFTFDLNNRGAGCVYFHYSQINPTIQTRIRIDHNEFKNDWLRTDLTPTFLSANAFTVAGDERAFFPAGKKIKLNLNDRSFYTTVASSSYGGGLTTIFVRGSGLNSSLSSIDYNHNTSQALIINGYRGVADNNTFTGIMYPVRFPNGASELWWNNWEGVAFGKEDNNFYLEDNVFEHWAVLVDCQYGNRYVFRYNKIISNYYSGAYPLMDMHGNQGATTSRMYSCFGGEVYGNNITLQGDGGQILDQRGGKTLVFYNKIIGKTIGVKIREENCDSDHLTEHLCPRLPDLPGNYSCSSDGQTQHVSDTYIWNNRSTVQGLKGGYIGGNGCLSYQLSENTDFYNHRESFDGTSGIGCGPIDSRPTKCIPGVAYWATNHSCDFVSDDIVGINPKKPIRGTLYKCNDAHKWTVYFTPYTYPHPLRNPNPP